MQSVSECSKMYAECMQIHEFACSYICLLAGPWACMQFLSMSEQLTRISQCFFLQDQWEKLLAVSICCCMIYVCYKELAIAGCKWFWCYLMQLLDEVGFPTPISNEVCDGIMRPGTCHWSSPGENKRDKILLLSCGEKLKCLYLVLRLSSKIAP